jgi:hypothetical protein
MFFNNRFDRSRNRKHRRPNLEALEGRQLMTLGARFPSPINTTTRDFEFNSVNASSTSGAEVVVWTHSDTPNNTVRDIRAQRLVNGKNVGPEILVSTGPVDDNPASVAMDNQGDFVVAWTQIQPNGNTFVLARKYGPSGNPIGGTVPVAVGTFAQTNPHVAMDAAGDFVVSYTRNTNNNNPDIFAKQYNVNEQLLNVVSVATTPSAETNSSVAMTPDGRFDVAYEVAVSKTVHDIILNQYNAQGGLTASRTIAADTADETDPSVSVDNFGNAVVAWQQNLPNDFNVFARRVGPNGSLGPVITIANTTALEFAPTVALERNGSGAFVVAYQSDNYNLNDDELIVAEVTPNPFRIGLPPSNTITSYLSGPQIGPALSINNSGQYLLTYTSTNTSFGLGYQNITGNLGQLPPSNGITTGPNQ